MKSKKFLSTMLAVAICILAFAGCNKQQEGVMQGESSNSSQSGTQTEYSDAKQIVLSDDGITVDGKTVAAGESESSVTVGGEIIYYHDMDNYESGNEYGDGNNSDRHTAE